ncbi:hypothetical protein M8C21_001368, partial [Ambrosia artemisiifolia]
TTHVVIVGRILVRKESRRRSYVRQGKSAGGEADLKYEENSKKAIQCLNGMVTNALKYIKDGLKYMSDLNDLAIFKFCVYTIDLAIGTLSMCYNNIQVFRGVVKMRRGSKRGCFVVLNSQLSRSRLSILIYQIKILIWLRLWELKIMQVVGMVDPIDKSVRL